MATGMAYINYVPQVGLETPAGTRTRAETKLEGLLFSTPSPEMAIETTQPYFSKYPNMSSRGASQATGSISGNLEYRSAYLFWAMLAEHISTTTTDGVSTHTFYLRKNAKDTNKTVSLQWGDADYTEGSDYCFLTEGGFSFDVNGSPFMELSGSWTGRLPVFDKLFYVDTVNGGVGDTFTIDVTSTDTTIPISVPSFDTDDCDAAITALQNIVDCTVAPDTGDDYTITLTTQTSVTSISIVDDTTNASGGISITGTGPYTLDLDGATSGTFRIRVKNTESITDTAHDATAATLETNLQALNCFSLTDIECSGGALGTAPVMIEVGGNWSSTQYGYKEVTFSMDATGMDSGSDANATLSRLSPDLTTVAQIPITVGENGDTDIIFARTEGELSTTTVDSNTYVPLIWSGEFSVSDLRSPIYQLQQRREGFTDVQEMQRSSEFTLGISATDVSSFLRWYAEQCTDKRFWGRIHSESCGVIPGTSTKFSQTIDLSLMVTGVGSVEEMEGSAGRTFTLQLAEDRTSDYVVKVTLVNDVTSSDF
jgi:hypothetical protein